MKNTTYIFFLLCFFNIAFGQVKTYSCEERDTTKHKKQLSDTDYKKYKGTNCSFKKYSDSKEAKDLFCRANFYHDNQQWYSALDLVKKAYEKSSTAKFKYQVLILTVDLHKQIGDTMYARKFQEQVNRIKATFLDIDK
jgi:hypothetical protein